MRKRAILSLAGTLVVVLFLLIWTGRRPSVANVSIALIGYTNDSTGLALARFGVTNLNWTTAEVYSPFIITQQVAVGSYSGYGPLPGYIYSARLNGGAMQVFTVPVPTNTTQWKLQLNCYTSVGTIRAIQNASTMMFVLLRLYPPYRARPYTIESAWVTNSGIMTNAGTAGGK